MFWHEQFFNSKVIALSYEHRTSNLVITLEGNHVEGKQLFLNNYIVIGRNLTLICILAINGTNNYFKHLNLVITSSVVEKKRSRG